jgi:hypothetical protein
MYDSTTVTVGLDVHARSIRLAAVRADELLEERTLPYAEQAVERALRPLALGSAAARRRGRPVSACTVTWLSAGSSAGWWRPGSCRSPG